MKTFFIKTRVLIGSDSMQYLQNIVNKTVWIVCDGFLENSGGLDHVRSSIPLSNRVEIYTNVVPDPPITAIIDGIQTMSKLKPEVVIALGGGSAIDTAKGIAYFSKKLNIAAIETFIAVPTTSGTGSEVTSVTVITDSVKNIKYPIQDPEIAPDIAILDPALTLSIPYNITANTGIDVLTHATEAYVAQNATICSDGLAEKSIQLVIEFLPKCCQELQNMRFREIMHNASTIAGLSFDIAGLGLNHSIAHQIGAKFHVPHGLANGMLLPHVIEFNSCNCLTACTKYARLSRLIGAVNSLCPDFQAVAGIRSVYSQLMRQLRMPATLSEFGVGKEQSLPLIDEIADQALKDFCITSNPCLVTHDDVVGIIRKIL